VICAPDKFFARAFPPSLPSACAFGFFLWIMPGIILLIVKHVKRKMQASAVFFRAIPPTGAIPTRSGHSAQIEGRGCVLPSVCGRECDCESRTQALASVPPIPLNQ
jgi:hypothetical protein